MRGDASHFLCWGAHGCQRRGEIGGHPLVVKPDHGYLLRDAFTGCFQGFQDTHRSLVVTGEDCIEYHGL